MAKDFKPLGKIVQQQFSNFTDFLTPFDSEYVDCNFATMCDAKARRFMLSALSSRQNSKKLQEKLTDYPFNSTQLRVEVM